MSDWKRTCLFAAALTIVVLPPSQVFGQELTGGLLPYASIPEGKVVRYNPFLGDVIGLHVYHYNYGDDLPEEISSGMESTDFYLFGLPTNMLAGGGGDDGLYADPLGLFETSVLGTLFSTEIDLYANAFQALNEPEVEGAVQSTLSAREIGVLFIPREAEIYLVEQGQRDYDFEDALGKNASELETFRTNFEESTVDSFRTWYESTAFTDVYGLVAKGVTPEANAVRDYSMAVLTTPTRFSLEELERKANGLIFLPGTEDEPFSSVSFSGDPVSNVDVLVGDRISHFGSLLDSGTIDNLYEAELFNVWFRIEYLLTDAYPLWMYAQSGQSALTVPQVVTDTALQLTGVDNTILSPGTSARRRAGSGSEGSDGDRVSTSDSTSRANANVPIGDTAVSFFSALGRQGFIGKTNVGYDFTFPGRRIDLGLNLNSFVTTFPSRNEDYITLDLALKGQWNFLRTPIGVSHLFATAGSTLNENVLMANYLNGSVGAYQEFFLGPFYTSVGAILNGSYWSQFPQLQPDVTTAARFGFDIGRFFGIGADAVYVRNLGSFYDGRWYSYEGPNVDYLAVGVSSDVFIGNSFTLNLGVRKDFLMENFSSIEISIGGGFVF